ncbi:MAG: hypothetical protein IK020_06555 [Clostridiales bacterium]|nr:hypothetical protein [Clostridiales bacterium]
MKRRHTRILSFAMSLMLLFSITAVPGCSKSTAKKDAAIIKKCQGTVEDYLVYLSSGKTGKLPRYADPDTDPFQDPDSLEDHEAVLWDALLRKLTFEIGEVELDDDEADVAVTISLPDARKIAKITDETLTYSSAADLVAACKDFTDADIEIPVTIDDDQVTIAGTDELYKQVQSQFQILSDAIPDGDEVMQTKVEEFMQNLHDLNIPYLYEHSRIPHLDDYDPMSGNIIAACNSFLTYEVEYVAPKDGNSADFIVHAHSKDSSNTARFFFSDPVNIAPAFCDAFDAMASGTMDFDKNYYEYIDIDALVPGFRDELENARDIDVDIPVTITVDDKDPSVYSIEGDFSEIMPPFEPLDYADEIDEEGQLACYQASIELLRAENRISDDEYEMCRRALGVYSFDEEAFRAVMAKYGFTQDTSYAFDELYTNGGSFQINLDNRDEIIESALANGDVLRDTKAMIEEGGATGVISGGWFDFEFVGSSTEDYISFEGDGDAEHTVYLRSIVINEYILAFMILDYTDDQIALIDTILQELGLE